MWHNGAASFGRVRDFVPSRGAATDAPMLPPFMIRLRGRLAGRVVPAALVCALWLGASGLQRMLVGAWRPSWPCTDLRAGLRLFAALSLGWPASIGLCCGSVIGSLAGWGPRIGAAGALLRALLSALSPFAAWGACMPVLRLRTDLRGVHLWQLLVLALVGALFWDLPDMLLLHHYGVMRVAAARLGERVLVNFGATLAVLYLGSIVGHLYLRRLARQAVRDAG